MEQNNEVFVIVGDDWEPDEEFPSVSEATRFAEAHRKQLGSYFIEGRPPRPIPPATPEPVNLLREVYIKASIVQDMHDHPAHVSHQAHAAAFDGLRAAIGKVNRVGVTSSHPSTREVLELALGRLLRLGAEDDKERCGACPACEAIRKALASMPVKAEAGEFAVDLWESPATCKPLIPGALLEKENITVTRESDDDCWAMTWSHGSLGRIAPKTWPLVAARMVAAITAYLYLEGVGIDFAQHLAFWWVHGNCRKEAE